MAKLFRQQILLLGYDLRDQSISFLECYPSRSITPSTSSLASPLHRHIYNSAVICYYVTPTNLQARRCSGRTHGKGMVRIRSLPPQKNRSCSIRGSDITDKTTINRVEVNGASPLRIIPSLTTHFPIDGGRHVLCSAGTGIATLSRSLIAWVYPDHSTHSTLGSTFARARRGRTAHCT